MQIERIVSNHLDSNVFVVTKDSIAIIVDAGAEVDKIKPFLRDKKVEGIFLTHGHYDHAMFALQYAKEFGCKIFASANIMKTLANPEINCSDGTFEIEDFSSFSFIKGNQELTLGKITVTAFETKGHSECSMCFLVDGNLFTGDTLFRQGMGRTDLIGGNAEDLYNSLAKIDSIAFEKLYCGHGDSSFKGEQLLNIKACRRYLKALSLRTEHPLT